MVTNQKSLMTFFVSLLMAATALAESADLASMEKARAFYAQGKMKEAIEIYKKIPVASDFWLDAIEEKAWAETSQGQFENALGDLQSVTSSIWAAQVGPETYMLSTFVSLKICAYKDVVKKITTFKKRMLPRVKELQALVQGNVSTEVLALFPDLTKLTMSSLGNKAERYPRYFYRDQKLISLVQAQNITKAQERIQELAQMDLDEIEANLKKMKIIEVELIQKVLMADNLKTEKKNLKFSQVDRDKDLIFPVTGDEIWVDEVGHFQVKADQCPFANKRSSL